MVVILEIVCLISQLPCHRSTFFYFPFPGVNCDNSDPSKICSECYRGFGLDKSGKCFNCSDKNCIECDEKQQCKTCYTGYGVKAGKCTKCPQDCEKCDAAGKCTEASCSSYNNNRKRSHLLQGRLSPFHHDNPRLFFRIAV